MKCPDAIARAHHAVGSGVVRSLGAVLDLWRVRGRPVERLKEWLFCEDDVPRPKRDPDAPRTLFDRLKAWLFAEDEYSLLDEVDSELRGAEALSRWSVESARAVAMIPAPVLAEARRVRNCEWNDNALLRAVELPLVLGLGGCLSVLLRAFLWGDYPPFGEQFTHALGWAAALGLLGVGVAVSMAEVARLRFGEYPRWRQRLQTHSNSGRELETLALALSRDHFSCLSAEERRTRAQCWWSLHDLALEAERCGEPTLPGWPSDRTPHPDIVELIMLARRWVTVALYGVGLLCLWQPAWQSAVPATPSTEASVPGSWPLSSAVLFLAAGAVHFVPVWGLRRWLGCSPEQVRRHYVPLAYLARARRLRRRIFSVLNDADPPRLGDVLIDEVATEIRAPVDAKDIVKRWLFMEEF